MTFCLPFLPPRPPQPRAPAPAAGHSDDHLRRAGGRGDARSGSAVVGPDGQQRVVGSRGRMEAPTVPPPPAPHAAPGPPRLPDWSRFDVQMSLQNLRSYDPANVRRELRKLHLRWYHASEPNMRLLLSRVGLDNVRLNMIKDVVDSCKTCRDWARPGNANMSSVSLPLKFNEETEVDLLFYKDKIICHMADRCIRWSAAKEISNKTMHTVLDAIHDMVPPWKSYCPLR